MPRSLVDADGAPLTVEVMNNNTPRVDVWFPVSVTASPDQIAAAASAADAASVLAKRHGFDFEERSDSREFRDFVVSATPAQAMDMLRQLRAAGLEHGTIDVVGFAPPNAFRLMCRARSKPLPTSMA